MTTTAPPQAILDYERVARAIQLLDDRAGSEPPTVDDVADHIGLSRSQLHRVFRRWAGTSPKRFLQYVTADQARDLLLDDTSVLDTAHEAGLSSPSRLHDLMVSIDAMTPGEVARRGAGLRIEVGIHPTPLGYVLVAVTPRGVCLLSFVEPDDLPDPVAAVRDRWPAAVVTHESEATWRTVAAAFEPTGPAAPIRLHVTGTNLQLKVWEALLRIPEGSAVSYGQLARSVKRPAAVRAVASAVGRNPVAYLIPCHRVIRATGHLGGYAWGLDRKRLLLARESSVAHPPVGQHRTGKSHATGDAR